MAILHDCSDPSELWRAMLAEFLATTFFVYIGCGTVVTSGKLNNEDGFDNVSATLVPNSMAFGMSAVALLYSIGGISGHMNPAVTLFFACIKKLTPKRAGYYILAQFLGGFAGAILVWASTSEIGAHNYYLGANYVSKDLNGGQAFLMEMVGTFTLCFTILFTQVKSGGPTDGKPNLSILCVGFAIFVIHLVLIPFTGCGINPARTFGPALVGEMVDHVGDSDIFFGMDCWAYYFGPLAGAAFTSALYFLFYEDASSDANLMREKPKGKATENMSSI